MAVPFSFFKLPFRRMNVLQNFALFYQGLVFRHIQQHNGAFAMCCYYQRPFRRLHLFDKGGGVRPDSESGLMPWSNNALGIVPPV